MKWILEHLQVIILVAGAIAYWLNQRKREKEGLPADYDEDGVPDNKPTKSEYDSTTMEAEEADRTRRVQEEIRRKIAQRRGQAVPPPVPALASPSVQRVPPAKREVAPPPVFQDPVAEMLKELQRRLAPEAAPAAPSQSAPPAIDQEMLERQRAMELRLKELEAERRAVKARAAAFAANQPATTEGRVASAGGSGSEWLAELKNPAAARRAIVLREVLGTPVGLR